MKYYRGCCDIMALMPKNCQISKIRDVFMIMWLIWPFYDIQFWKNRIFGPTSSVAGLKLGSVLMMHFDQDVLKSDEQLNIFRAKREKIIMFSFAVQWFCDAALIARSRTQLSYSFVLHRNLNESVITVDTFQN